MDGEIMANFIVNKEPMDWTLIQNWPNIGIKDSSRRDNAGGFGLWKIDTGLPESALFVVRQTYPDAILVSNESDARRAVRESSLYQKYLDSQPPDYGEQQYYSYHASGNLTELIQAHIPQELAVEFKVMCHRKRIKQREALATIIAEWLGYKAEPNSN